MSPEVPCLSDISPSWASNSFDASRFENENNVTLLGLEFAFNCPKFSSNDYFAKDGRYTNLIKDIPELYTNVLEIE